MIGSGLKKLASEHGMQVSNGVAYGSLRGYATTMSEGTGYKAISFSLTFPDPAQKALLLDAVSVVDVQKEYRVQQLQVMPKTIQVTFFDNPGTMKKISAFLDWFIPLLDQHAATKADICAECGMQVSGGSWKLINGVAHYMHQSCGEKVRGQITEGNEQRKQEATGSYVSGTVGALLGAAVGAILWALVLNLGYVASIVGLAIGFLAEKGYNLLKGKQGKAKVAILAIAVIVGVLLGTFAADAFTLISMINEGEAYLTYGEIPAFLMELLAQEPEYQSAVISNILMGLLFAALGVFALLRKTSKAVADKSFIDLK